MRYPSLRCQSRQPPLHNISVALLLRHVMCATVHRDRVSNLAIPPRREPICGGKSPFISRTPSWNLKKLMPQYSVEVHLGKSGSNDHLDPPRSKQRMYIFISAANWPYRATKNIKGEILTPKDLRSQYRGHLCHPIHPFSLRPNITLPSDHVVF